MILVLSFRPNHDIMTLGRCPAHGVEKMPSPWSRNCDGHLMLATLPIKPLADPKCNIINTNRGLLSTAWNYSRITRFLTGNTNESSPLHEGRLLLEPAEPLLTWRCEASSRPPEQKAGGLLAHAAAAGAVARVS